MTAEALRRLGPLLLALAAAACAEPAFVAAPPAGTGEADIDARILGVWEAVPDPAPGPPGPGFTVLRLSAPDGHELRIAAFHASAPVAVGEGANGRIFTSLALSARGLPVRVGEAVVVAARVDDVASLATRAGPSPAELERFGGGTELPGVLLARILPAGEDGLDLMLLADAAMRARGIVPEQRPCGPDCTLPVFAVPPEHLTRLVAEDLSDPSRWIALRFVRAR